MKTAAVPQLHLVHPHKPTRRETDPESPRERLIERGSTALTDAELVAVLLDGGSLGDARALLGRCGGLAGIGSVESLAAGAEPGLGEARLAAAVELARRLARREMPLREPMSQPARVAAYLELQYCRAGQEVMGALFVDARHRLIADREFFRGTMKRLTADPGPILREALLSHATGVVLFHTHPSTDPAPSREDLAFTRRFAKAGEVLGVELVDHMIVARGGEWLSVKARGGW
jgi:DNA repair protein RadC